jgi:Holliday junction resolvase RusA-like endonuclease
VTQHPDPLVFTVPGVPIPKGSLVPMKSQSTGKCLCVEGSRKLLRPWRKEVTTVARLARTSAAWPVGYAGPVAVKLAFHLVRPASVPLAERLLPVVKPDIDKVTRTILDDLKNAHVYGDDAQIVQLHVTKTYAPAAGVDVEVHACR